MCPNIADHHHIIQCKSLPTSNHWNDSLEEFHSQLQQMHTPTKTIEAIKSLLVRYRSGIPLSTVVRDQTLADAMHKQQQLSPCCFIEGLLVHEWRDHVATFLPPKQSNHR